MWFQRGAGCWILRFTVKHVEIRSCNTVFTFVSTTHTMSTQDQVVYLEKFVECMSRIGLELASTIEMGYNLHLLNKILHIMQPR